MAKHIAGQAVFQLGVLYVLVAHGQVGAPLAVRHKQAPNATTAQHVAWMVSLMMMGLHNYQ
jgi:hypothetical protein